MTKFKVALIGCGILVQIFVLPTKRQISQKIVSLHDIDENKAQSLKSDFYLNAKSVN
jgi:predicted dehydrogenase